ncbi:phage tail tape measure protein [Kribbella sp. NPDC023855]|uniref:phage tail tape measure protein n=1 Tax=Kribbella sp. NPDC023855 TaxID=3154698 RepID=UPI0033F9B873
MPGIVKIAFLADVGAAKVGLSQFSSDVESTVDKAGKDWSGLKDKLKLGALGAAAALGAGLAEGLDFGAAQSKLQAQLGLTGKDAEKIGAAAGDLYKSGFGESVEDAGDTIRAAFENGVVGINDSREAIAAVGADIQNYIVLSGEDAQASTRAVAQILKNKLAPNAKAAFDLLVRGQQLGINKSEDLLDTFTEYSTQFRALGIDGPKALGLLNQGLRAGARDADTVADSLKEFAIRAKDGSATTVEGFKSIGLNADKMQQIFAKGGPGASAGLDLVLDRLRAMEDPVKRDAAAVALFGTKAEDMQAALFALDPSTAVQGLGDLAGAADRAGTTLNDNAKARLTSFTRTVKTNVVDFLGTKVIPKLEEWGTSFGTKVQPKIDAFVDKGLPKIKTALGEVVTFIDDNKQTFLDLATNTGQLADNLEQKLSPALSTVAPHLKTVAEIDLSNQLASLKALNTLLSSDDGGGETPGIVKKFEAIGKIAEQANLGTKFGNIAGNAIFEFGQRFVTDSTMQANAAGWLSRNLSNLASFLPLGSLASAGTTGALAVSSAFGAHNPAGAVSRVMVKLGAAAIQYNPISIFQRGGALLGSAIDRGLLGSQPTVTGRAAALAKNTGSALINALPGGAVVSALVRMGGDAMGGLDRGLRSGLDKAVGFVRGIPGALAASGGNWGGALFNAGSRVISGLIDGIQSKLPSLQGVLSGVTNIIPSWKGPLDKDKRLLKPAGAAIMGGLIDEIKAQLPDLKRTLGDVSTLITGGLSADPTVNLTAAGALAGGAQFAAGAAGPVVVNVYALTDGPEVGRRVVSAIQDYEGFNGTSWRAVPA